MDFVVDASVATKWVLPEEDADIAQALLSGGHKLFAPRLMASEVANAIWKTARTKNAQDKNLIEQSNAVELAARFRILGVNWADDEVLRVEALRLALEIDHPVYDCVYLALALELGVTLLTADRKFAEKVAKRSEHGGSIMLLADYANDQ